MSWSGQQDKVPSSHSEEPSGTIFSQTQIAGVWDGVTEHPRFKTPNTRRIRKFSPNHISSPPSPLGHSHIGVPAWCHSCKFQEVALQSPNVKTAMTSQLTPTSFNLLSRTPGTPPSHWGHCLSPSTLHTQSQPPTSHMPPLSNTTHYRKRYNTPFAQAPQPKGIPYLPSSY